MSRPRKCRRVCCMPKINEFKPVFRGNNNCCKKEPVILTVDEYETLRLIDMENYSQEECGEYMQVARTTIQQIYNSARAKVAEALVCGKVLRIEGGEYRICEGDDNECCPECDKECRNNCEKECKREMASERNCRKNSCGYREV